MDILRRFSGPNKDDRLQPLRRQQKPFKSEPAIIFNLATRGSIAVETHLAISSNNDGYSTVLNTVSRMGVVDARNTLAKATRSISVHHPLPFIPKEYYAIWCDDDSWWPEGTIANVVKCLAIKQVDIIVGFFGKRLSFGTPLAFRDSRGLESYPRIGVDCNPGTLVEIKRAGFHFVAHRASILNDLDDDPFNLEHKGAMEPSEDFAFFSRCEAAGFRIFCATGMPIAHIDVRDGAAYVPGLPAMRVERNQLVQPSSGEHIGADGKPKVMVTRSYDGSSSGSSSS